VSVRSILRALWIILLAGAIFEVLARLDDWVRFGASPVDRYDIEEVFKTGEFGKQGKPLAKFKKWEMNSLGFRGPEPAADSWTVLVHGASESFGIFESPGHEYPRLLEKELKRLNPRYSVVNAAMPGMRFGRDAYLIDAIQRTNAKAVVIYPTPLGYFGINEGVCGNPKNRVMGNATRGPLLRAPGKLYDYLKRSLPDQVGDFFRSTHSAIQAGSTQLASTWSKEDLEAFEADLKCITDKVRQAGATPLLLTHATIFGARFEMDYPVMLNAWQRFYPMLDKRGFRRIEIEANELIRRVGVSHGFPVLDLAQGIEPGPKMFADFVHFSDAGAQAVASQIATKFGVNGLLGR
jgi:hypothetical protein